MIKIPTPYGSNNAEVVVKSALAVANVSNKNIESLDCKKGAQKLILNVENVEFNGSTSPVYMLLGSMVSVQPEDSKVIAGKLKNFIENCQFSTLADHLKINGFKADMYLKALNDAIVSESLIISDISVNAGFSSLNIDQKSEPLILTETPLLIEDSNYTKSTYNGQDVEQTEVKLLSENQLITLSNRRGVIYKTLPLSKFTMTLTVERVELKTYKS